MYFITFIVLVVIQGSTADTGSDTTYQCQRQCDLIQEMQVLRQLVNQETLLRMKMEEKIQGNTDKITEMNQSNESVFDRSTIQTYNQSEFNEAILNMMSGFNTTLHDVLTRLEDLKADQMILKLNQQKIEENLSVISIHLSRKDGECSDIKNSNASAASGVYQIYLGNLPFNVYCDMETDGGGWTVFQRRMDGSVNFTRDWLSYKKGFGNMSTEFWLGNDALHTITERGRYHLRVDMETFTGETAYATYSTFHVANEASGYKLDIGGYSGTAGDTMARVNGARFSTIDKDLDNSGYHCAQHYSSPFWWNNCGSTSPNGYYIKTGNYQSRSGYYGIFWYQFKGWDTSMKTFSMMLRRV